MTMLDKSDFAPLVPIGTDGDKEIARLEKEEGIGASMRDEAFVSGAEYETGEWKLQLEREEAGEWLFPFLTCRVSRLMGLDSINSGILIENVYERPLSRAALTMLTDSLGTPSLAV
jgi:hypothetical protein